VGSAGAQQSSEKHFQRVEQACVATLNEIAGQPKQLQMTPRVHFGARLWGVSMAGANHVHNAPAGGCNQALDARQVLVALPEKFGHGYIESLRYLAQGLRAWLKVAILNPGEVRAGNARTLAQLPLADALLVADLHHARSNAHECLPPMLFRGQS
jgi:hypothetical protein